MSKATIVDNDLLKKEIKALYDYVNRDAYNLYVVEVMTNEIQDIVKGLKPCEITDSRKVCPNCYSTNIKALSATYNPYDSMCLTHYICQDCHKEFEV